MTGPFETGQEAHAAALALGGPPHRNWAILSDAQNRAMLLAACASAGVTLGAFDERILAWLAGYEDTTCAVISGLVLRAHEAGRAAR